MTLKTFVSSEAGQMPVALKLPERKRGVIFQLHWVLIRASVEYLHMPSITVNIKKQEHISILILELRKVQH
jgi:hypothetical protein